MGLRQHDFATGRYSAADFGVRLLCCSGGLGKIHHQGRRAAPHEQIAFKGQLFVSGDDGVAANREVLGEQAGGRKCCAAWQNPAFDEATKLAIKLAMQIGGDAAVNNNAIYRESGCHGGS